MTFVASVCATDALATGTGSKLVHIWSKGRR